MTSKSKPSQLEATPEAGARLQGNLGTIDLLFMTLAFQAPLISIGAYLPFVLGLGLGAAGPIMNGVTITIMLLFSVGLVAMARRMEKPGGLYTYIGVGLGSAAGLGAGLVALGSYILLAVSNVVVSGITVNQLIHYTFHGPDIPWWLCGLALWAGVSALTLFNIEVSGKVLGFALILEVLIVLIWEVRVFINGGPQGRGLPIAQYWDSSKLGFALLWGMAGYVGFEAIQMFRSESRDPDKTVPRATYLTVIVLGVFYGIASWAYLVSYGTAKAMATAANPTEGFLGSLQIYVGSVLKDTANVLMATSAIALVLASQNIAARYVFTLAEDSVFPHSLSRVHPRHHSPQRASIVIASVVLVGLLVPAVSGLNAVTFYTATAGVGLIGILVLLTVCGLAILTFFARNRGPERSIFKTFVAPLLGTAGLGTVVVLATIHRADFFGGDESLATICMILIAAVFVAGVLYATWLRSRRADVYAHVHESIESAPDSPLAKLD